MKRLKSFCRKDCGDEAVYKPLGKLKRWRQSFSNEGDGDIDGLFDDYHVIPVKRALCVPPPSPPTDRREPDDEVLVNSEPPACFIPEFHDCEESNEEDEEEEIDGANAEETSAPRASWHSFFQRERDEDWEREMAPHSPKLFSDSEDGDSTHDSSQSTHISERASQSSGLETE